MARDIEADIKFNDKSAAGLRSAEQNLIKSSNNIKKNSDKLGDGIGKALVTGITKVAPALGDSLTKAFTAGSASAGPIIAGAAVVAAPLIAGTLSAAVIGGAGIGGLVGGAIIAARDPRIKAAATALGSSINTSLEADADVLVEPLLGGLRTLEAGFEQIRPKIANIFRNSGTFVQPLAQGISKALDGIITGVDKAVANAGPVIESFGRLFEQTGGAIGDLFSTLSDNSDAAASSIDDLTIAIVSFTRTTAAILDAGAATKGFFDNVDQGIDRFRYWVEDNSALAKSLQDVGLNLDLTADGYAKGSAEAEAYRRKTLGVATAADEALLASAPLATNIQNIGTLALTTGGPIQALSDKMRALASTSGSLFDASTSAGEAIARLKDSIDANGATLDSNTQKGRANRQAVSNLAKAYRDQYDAAVTVNGIGPKTDAVARSNYSSFVRLATSLTGSRQKAEALARQLGLLPPSKTIKVNANTHDAAARLKALEEQRISDKSFTVTTIFKSRGDKNAAQLARSNGGNFSATGFAAYGAAGTLEPAQPISVTAGESYFVIVLPDGTVTEAKARAISKEELGKYTHKQKYKRS